MRPGLAFLLACLATLVLNCCVANHSRKTYQPVRDTAIKPGSFQDDFVVQVHATSYSSNILANDDRAPYRIHTRYWTNQAYRTYSIDHATIECGSFRQTLATPADKLLAHGAKNQHGLYQAEIDLPRHFDHVPQDPSQPLRVVIRGKVSTASGVRSFEISRHFRYDVYREVMWVTFDALMGI